MNQKYSGNYSSGSNDVRGLLRVEKVEAGEQSPIEKMPHILAKVHQTWGKKDFNLFVNSLLMDSRNGKRQGFPAPIVEDLVMLAEVNTIGRALLIARRMNVPYRDALRKIEAELEQSNSTDPFADPAASRETARYENIDERKRAKQGERSAPQRQDAESGGAMGFIMRLVLNRYTLMLLIGLMTLRAVWPYLFR